MKKLITLGVALMLFGCGGGDMKNYENTTPKLKINEFYDREVAGYGYYANRSGEVTSRYYVRLVPKWEGNKGTLQEYNYEAGGENTSRSWAVTLVDENHFTATGSDLVGTLKGEMRGFAMHMQYKLLVPRGDGKIAVDFDDWTYLQPDGTALNKVSLSKFGFNVGELVYHLHKVEKGKKPQESFSK